MTKRVLQSVLVFLGLAGVVATAHADNKYVFNQMKTQAELKLSFRPLDPKGTIFRGYDWQTAYNSYTKPRASVSIYCTDSGWRVYSFGPVVYGATPEDWFRKHAKATGEVIAEFHDVQGLKKKAVEEWCPAAMKDDIGKATIQNQYRTVEIVKNWKVRISGKCIRTKIPYKGKQESVAATKSVPVKVKCSYAPTSVHLDSIPLDLYYSNTRKDNFVTSTSAGISDAKKAGYVKARVEARVQEYPGPNTIPLRLYWHPGNQDNLSITPEVSVPSGYSFVRNQGYVFKRPRKHAVPLKLYWSASRKEYFTTATSAGEAAAKIAGYTLVKTIGYVLPHK